MTTTQEAQPATMFRACWPITDPTTPYADLTTQAAGDLPLLLRQAGACPVVGEFGRWYITASSAVPGSGRITDKVLIYEVRAHYDVRRAARPYRKATR